MPQSRGAEYYSLWRGFRDGIDPILLNSLVVLVRAKLRTRVPAGPGLLNSLSMMSLTQKVHHCETVDVPYKVLRSVLLLLKQG